jgi:hypothetical protein
LGWERTETIGSFGGFAAGHVVASEGSLGHERQWKVLEGVTQVAARVALLEEAKEEDGKGSSGYDAELAFLGYGTGQAPTGDADAHAALNDAG